MLKLLTLAALSIAAFAAPANAMVRCRQVLLLFRQCYVVQQLPLYAHRMYGPVVPQIGYTAPVQAYATGYAAPVTTVARGVHNPCPLGGEYHQETRSCIVSGDPTPDIANDDRCRGKPVGYKFDVAIKGPHGELGVDHRVCGVRSN